MRFGTILELECGNCGRVDEYNVGIIFVDVYKVEKSVLQDEATSYSGYFRCSKCNSAWPFHLTDDSKLQVMAIMITEMDNKDSDILQLIEPRLFDGTRLRSGAQGVDYLKSILEREPDNGFVWNRLGNLYRACYLNADALEAYRKAVEIDPTDIESQYSIGAMLEEQGLLEESADHLHEVLHWANKHPEVDITLKRHLVSSALDTLVSLFDDTDGEITIFPNDKSEDEERFADAREFVKRFGYEVYDDEEMWNRLVNLIIGGSGKKGKKKSKR